MLTNRARYALKALIYLARHRNDGPIQGSVISQAEGIPVSFLEQILAELRRRTLVRSRSCKGGGYVLARNPADIDVLTVIRAIDGPIAPLPCLSKTAYHRCADCPDEGACGTRRLLHRAHDQSLQTLSSITLADALTSDGGFAATDALAVAPALVVPARSLA